jgi:hypothetical protein
VGTWWHDPCGAFSGGPEDQVCARSAVCMGDSETAREGPYPVPRARTRPTREPRRRRCAVTRHKWCAPVEFRRLCSCCASLAAVGRRNRKKTTHHSPPAPHAWPLSVHGRPVMLSSDCSGDVVADMIGHTFLHSGGHTRPGFHPASVDRTGSARAVRRRGVASPSRPLACTVDGGLLRCSCSAPTSTLHTRSRSSAPHTSRYSELYTAARIHEHGCTICACAWTCACTCDMCMHMNPHAHVACGCACMLVHVHVHVGMWHVHVHVHVHSV